MSQKLAFLGLGVMGFPMAGHLARAGHEVTVYNRTKEKARAWSEKYGGQTADTPADAAKGASVVFLCVGNDADVREVVCGEGGALSGMDAGTILVDHTTTSASLARELSVLADKKQVGFLDAPVSGGQAGAENGALTVMMGGNSEAFETVRPLIDVYAKQMRLMGEVGTGQLTKMVNQICIAGLVQGLSEGLHFAEQAGLDGRAVIDVISKGAAQSWQMENRYETMIDEEFDHGFAVDWMRKDLGFCLDEARRNKAHLPVTALVDQFYAEVQSMGGGRWDTSSLIARLKATKKKAT